MSDRDIEVAERLATVSAQISTVLSSLTEHKLDTQRQFIEATAARRSVYEKLEQTNAHVARVEHKVDAQAKTLESYEPDLKRCRMWRNWGAATILLISVVGTIVLLWNNIITAFGNAKKIFVG